MSRNNSSFSPSAPVLVIGGAGVDLVGRLDDELRPGLTSPAKIRTSYGGVARQNPHLLWWRSPQRGGKLSPTRPTGEYNHGCG
jgi:hypothetical protein